jgi:cobalt transporter subunit CbtB
MGFRIDPELGKQIASGDAAMIDRTASNTEAVAFTARFAPALAVMLFGAFLVLGVGFAHSDTVHNAAHDGRHSFAFPCH